MVLSIGIPGWLLRRFPLAQLQTSLQIKIYPLYLRGGSESRNTIF